MDMLIQKHQRNGYDFAEIQSDQIVIGSSEDGLDLLGNIYFQGYHGMILHAQNITPAFFDLQNGMAGEILQKFSNYRMGLVIVGNFEDISRKSLRDFIYESNNTGLIQFVSSIEEALIAISR